ncbi:protein UsfY [Mycobacterium sp. Aquia_213]|uniref:protein UsfY n=1 Tax=Mycobacterium sp. Aquia_213 TaxID=2991728 RepID=UPI002271ED58|nr:protein UsfY [Mycobacterium sp. Aquia_213]WAC89281.1 protein UsfY [Mycobacterium sp. Aquia_213]
MGDTADPTDHFRTTCPHAGEFLIDRLCWPGLMAIVLGVASLVGGVAAAAYRHQEWLLTLVTVGVSAIVAGLVWLKLEHRRVMKIESRWLSVYSTRGPRVS